jgi:predicted permease
VTPPRPGTRSSSERLYRQLLRAYPTETRQRSGPDMVDTFRDAHRRARRSGHLAVYRLWFSVLLDLAVSAVPDRLDRRRRRRTSRLDRKGSIVETLWQDIRFGVRGLRKSPGFTLVVLTTLGLGIGANTAIFSLINDVLLRPLPVANPDRVVRVYTSDFSSGSYGGSSFPDFRDFAEQSSTLSGLAAFGFPIQATLKTSETGDRITTRLVSGDYFSVLGLTPAAGRFIEPSDDQAVGAHPVAVISWGMWHARLGGRTDALGQTVTINGSPFTIIGVAPERFTGIELGTVADVWAPITMYGTIVPFLAGRPMLEIRGARWLRLVGRTAPGASVERVHTELNGIMSRLADAYPQSNRGTLRAPDAPRPVTVVPAHDAALGGGQRAATETRALLLMGIVGVVLLITCANVANLLVARSARRRREIAVRLAIGAGRGRVVQQMLTESTLLGLMGGAAGLVMAALASRFLIPLGLPSALQSSLDRMAVSIDARVLAFTLVISVVTGLVFGCLPAWQASRAALVPALKDADTAGGSPVRRVGLRDVLVVVQIAGSLVLLFGAGLFIRSTLAAYRTDLGFNVHSVLVASFDVSQEGMAEDQGQTFLRQLLDRTRGLPGVESSALAMVVPVDPSGSRSTFQPEGYEAQPEEDMELNFNVVSPGFFETLQIPLLAGRVFAQADSEDGQDVAVVNRTFVERFWPDGNAVGRRIDAGGSSTIVVGVVNDSKYRGVREDPMPYVYTPLAQSYRSQVTLAVRTSGDPEAALGGIRDVVRELAGAMPLYRVQTLRDQLDASLAQTRSTTAMIGSLGLLALTLAAIGVYGVMAYSVAQRHKEMGIRTALGASRWAVVGLVLTRGLGLAGAGVTLGLAGALILSRMVGGFVADVSPTDPLTFGAVALLMGMVAVIASVLPAFRASRIDPMVALRYE